MADISGSNSIIRIGTAVNISTASHLAGTVTVDTSIAHGLTTGDRVEITGVVGITDLNGYFSVDVTDTDTFTVSLTTAQTYTSGGSIQSIIPITSGS